MRKTFSHYVKKLLALDDTPERIARAFAVGVFLAFSPLIGLHLFLGFGLAFLCGRNRFALFLGLFITNPWTLVPISAAGTVLGSMILGFPDLPGLPALEPSSVLRGDFWKQVAGHWHILKPMLLGSFFLAFLLSAMSYVAALSLLRQRRARRQSC